MMLLLVWLEPFSGGLTDAEWNPSPVVLRMSRPSGAWVTSKVVSSLQLLHWSSMDALPCRLRNLPVIFPQRGHLRMVMLTSP